MRAEETACVVLASGLSQRFGALDKLEAKLCDKSVLGHVFETIEAVGFGEIFVLTQKQSEGRFTWVVNSSPEDGQGHALRLGLASARSAGWETICVVLGDMPLVQTSHLQLLLGKLEGKSAVVSACKEQTMPPAIFREEAIDLILSDQSQSGARTILGQLKPVIVPICEEAALDVDTPEDLIRVRRIMESRYT